MKRIFFLILWIAVTGCVKEVSEPEYTAVGTYKLISAQKKERIFWGDSNEYRKDTLTYLNNYCSNKSIITINSNGTFEKLDYELDGERCESEIENGRWPNKPVIYNNNLGEFKVDNSTKVYEVYSKASNTINEVVKIDVTYGSITGDPSGRYIYTYMRVN